MRAEIATLHQLSPAAPGELVRRWTTAADNFLLLTDAGAIRLDTPSERCFLPADHVACVGAGQRYRLSSSLDSRVIQLVLPGDRSARLHALDHDQPLLFAAPPVMRELMREAASWSERPPEVEVQQAFLVTFCGLLDRWCGPPLPLDLPIGQSVDLRRGLLHLLDRLERPVGLADAARAASVSDRTIQRRCRTELGLALSAWLTRARVLSALELLHQPALSVGEVALRCGYQSAAAFTRAFSQHLGSTPSAWRPRR